MGDTLEELLDLFDLKLPLTEKDIKMSKKKVMLLHPDKNNGVENINQIFIKYIQAYKKLEKIYSFTTKNKPFSHEDIDTTFKDFIVKNKYDKKQFHIHFNKMFDNVFVKDDEGYEQWLKSDEDLYFKDNIELSRKIILKNELAVSGEPEFYNKQDYYSDLKTAHKNTLIPIDCDKVFNETPKFNNVNDYSVYRKKNEPIIMSPEKSKQYLQQQYNKEAEECIKLAFKYKTQEEKMEKNRVNYYSKFLIIE